MIGAGGMGEVYRARDGRLNRTVAIKVLPPTLTGGPGRRARFEREARAIAALSHPNICAIYDVGCVDETDYLVMEYLEGETLADRVARGPLPLSLVLRYGEQIAEALHQAHRAGIVHRDLKPGNILLTSSGVKLLDFGLAKSLHDTTSQSGADHPTEVAPLTAEGTVLGTLQYMSPEQIEGKAVDHRADLFALGLVLYEMASGRRAFEGSSRTALITAVLSTDPPPLRSLQPAMPASLERVIATALEKNADERWQTAHDLARQLRWIADSSSSSSEVPSSGSPKWSRLVLFVIAGALVAALLTWASMRALTRRSATTTGLRLDLASPKEVVPARDMENNEYAISPEGKTLAYLGLSAGKRFLYLRDFDSDIVRKVTGSEDATAPFWSSDGQWIAFSSQAKLWKARRSGDTPPEFLCEVGASAGAVGSWSGHTILFSDYRTGRASIFRVADSGGNPVALTTPSATEWRPSWPYFLPDGEHFVYQASSTHSIDRDLVLTSLAGKARTVLLHNVSQVRSVGSDRLLYVRDGKLLAQRYDLSRGVLQGEPVTVADNVAYFYPTAHADFDAVSTGMVVYRGNESIHRLSILDRTGIERKLLDDQSGRFFDVGLSRDGKTAAVSIFSRENGLSDIWFYDLARGVRDRFTHEPGMEFSPVWSPDGRWIIYSSADGGTKPHMVRRALGGSAIEEITPRGPFRFPHSISPDGQTLYFVEQDARTNADIHRLSMQSRKDETILNSDLAEDQPDASPDGKWLAYTSDPTQTNEIYLQSLSQERSGRIRISTNGGTNPRWSGDGRELFFTGGDGRTLFAAHSTSGHWEDASIERLFTTPGTIVDFAVLPDAQSMVVLQTTPGVHDDLFHVIAGLR